MLKEIISPIHYQYVLLRWGMKLKSNNVLKIGIYECDEDNCGLVSSQYLTQLKQTFV